MGHWDDLIDCRNGNGRSFVKQQWKDQQDKEATDTLKESRLSRRFEYYFGFHLVLFMTATCTNLPCSLLSKSSPYNLCM